uniref:Uncharacterized protein n=1 Tax=viral metagenome TaxID=1070528 RepID=A0A6C0HVV9_9ZZZZ
MITHTLYGGLGNQLFQIFTAISLSLKSGHEFYFELKEDSLLETSSLLTALLPFCKSAEECRALEQHLHVHHIREPESHQYNAYCFDKVFTSSNHEHLFILEGYFQSYLYFQNEFDTIVQMLGLDKQREHLSQTIQPNMNDVAIHFRLGDYKTLQHTHTILTCNYYRNALNTLDRSAHELARKQNGMMPRTNVDISRVVYICQQEDQDMVESYYIPRLSKCFPQYTWISIYELGIHKDEEQLLYMSLMNSLVIANSSFSLWAAYLNKNNPCICYPSVWIKNLGDDTWCVAFSKDDVPETVDSTERLCFIPHISHINHPKIHVEDMFYPSWKCIKDTLDSTIDNIMSTLTTLPIPMTQCLCYKNQTKKTSMIQRFETIGLPLQIYEGVSFTDPRIINFAYSEGQRRSPEEYERKNSLSVQRLWSVTYGHLDMIQRFLDTEQPYGLFCEDDILVNRTLPDHIQNIMEECKEMQVDCLLLGYMITFKVEGWMEHYEEIQPFPSRSYRYHNYPDELWGVHMYMLSRAGALKIIETYANGYADVPNHVFSPDWTISKCPGVKRAIIYPMFAVEDGKDTMEHYNHDGQYQFHMNTFKHNYISEVFI